MGLETGDEGLTGSPGLSAARGYRNWAQTSAPVPSGLGVSGAPRVLVLVLLFLTQRPHKYHKAQIRTQHQSQTLERKSGLYQGQQKSEGELPTSPTQSPGKFQKNWLEAGSRLPGLIEPTTLPQWVRGTIDPSAHIKVEPGQPG